MSLREAWDELRAEVGCVLDDPRMKGTPWERSWCTRHGYEHYPDQPCPVGRAIDDMAAALAPYLAEEGK